MAPEDASPDALRAENIKLRAQVDELTREVERLSRWQMLAQATLDASPNMIYVRDLDYRYTVVNKTCEEFIDLRSDQILGRHDTELLPPEIIGEIRDSDLKILSTREGSVEEQVMPHPDGPHTFVNNKFPIFDAGGQVVALGGISADVTARKQAEAGLRESQTLLKALLDNSPSLIVVKDPEGRYLVVNHQAERALRRSEEAVLGKTDFEIWPPADAEQVSSRHKRVFSTGEPINREETLNMPDGRRSYLMSTFPLRDAQGDPYATCAIITDITDRKRQEEERARHREDLIQAQESALRELSTPLIPFADQVVIMPLIGSIDSVRARQALETLLEGTARHQASIAIIDITGVPNVDADIAHGLIGAAKAVQLLGAKTVLTGIRPEVARTLAELDIDLSGVVTQGTLQSGVTYALAAARRQGRGGAM